MRKTIFGCLGAAALAFALQFTPADVQAQGIFGRLCDPCDAAGLCDPCDRIGNGSCFDNLDCAPCGALNGCGPKLGKWFLNGHMEAGFFANGHGNKSTYNSPREADLTSGNTGFLQNTRLTGGQFNQLYLSAGRSVDGRRGLDIGGTVDFTWGSDGYKVQAAGMEYAAGHGQYGWGTGDYYAAFAQAYVEAEYGRLNVKAGKFYAPFGIDSYKSTENFFYSWSPTKYIVPTTAGGAYATYKLNDQLSVLGGWAMPDEIGEGTKYNTGIGGVTWTPGKRFTASYTFAVGKNNYAAGGYRPLDADVGRNDGSNVFVHSLNTTTHINQKLKYVFDWTLVNVTTKGWEQAGANPRVNWRTPVAQYALMNELVYQHNRKWAFGTRFGVLNSNAYAAAGGATNDWYTVSLGANWTPNKWLTVKPEVRYDWVKGKNEVVTPFNGWNNTYQVSGGMSAVVKF